MAAAVLAVASLPALGQEKPVDSGYEEKVEVELVQIEVSVWPKHERDGEACVGLGRDDFELIVNGRPRAITAVDWLGAPEAMSAIDQASIADPANPPLTIVLVFDLWHLDVFFRAFECPRTKPLAFEKARELVRRQFRAGDRLLLVTFAGWPQIHEGWIRDPAEALRALDRLEVSPFVMRARQEHAHHQDWLEGFKSLFLALGRYPGRKEVFYLGDDFRFDDVALQVYDLAARAQANRVSMHGVDLLESCRTQIGPGCPGVDSGGLGCTEFKLPLALGIISTNTGGELFKGSSSLADAVETVRRMRRCKYLISFAATSKDGRRSPLAKVRITRAGLQLDYPSSFGSPRREPQEREQQEALFLLPRFGEGIQAEIGLWPLRPTPKGNRWSGMMVARLRRAPQEPWPAALHRIEIEAAASIGSSAYKDGTFRKVLEGDELRRFAEGESRLFVFPLERIKPGLNAASLRALGVGGDVSANVRSYLDVPDAPGPGESGPWQLVSELARVGAKVTVMPSLSGRLSQGQGGLILSYGCPAQDLGRGELVALEGQQVVPIPIDWFDPTETNAAERGCDWLAGIVEPGLVPGLWRFESPASLAKEGEKPYTVEFRVAAAGEAEPADW